MSKLIKNLIGFIIALYISLFRIAPDIGELINMYNNGDPQFATQIIIRVFAFLFIFLFITRIIEAIHMVVYAIKRIKQEKNNGRNVWDRETFRNNNNNHHSTLNGGVDDDNKWDFTK